MPYSAISSTPSTAPSGAFATALTSSFAGHFLYRPLTMDTVSVPGMQQQHILEPKPSLSTAVVPSMSASVSTCTWNSRSIPCGFGMASISTARTTTHNI
eukprot:CAMPEP_0174707802 /NCGR_PEP_ID=MMETSP1094-20130205/10224_1 /TAXON_ID=156173 /ORGANISM="Chrysochromulina brevifilum, Strain UTEX LB 985" /LENGTH=98 /DNA_ID=CAMNT_0015906243 /DNA_START=454 /DNA_END=750 /DNA_ORIENTATION=+